MSERDEFEAWAIDTKRAYRDEKHGLCFYDAGAKAPSWDAWQAARATPQQAVPALTDEQIARLRASLFSQVESELAEKAIAMLTASPAALTHEQFMGFRDAVDDLECELQTRYQGYPEDDRRRVRDFAVVKRARELLLAAAPQPSPEPRRYQD